MTIENRVSKPQTRDLRKLIDFKRSDVPEQLIALERMDPTALGILTGRIDPVQLVICDRLAIVSGNVD
ncbi:hypothetical protein HYU93_02160 [Candidatus Daviesbacteria bacterium]|nr:hypothetical protein [Candidatus Daviesbacteria bacterium]